MLPRQRPRFLNTTVLALQVLAIVVQSDRAATLATVVSQGKADNCAEASINDSQITYQLPRSSQIVAIEQSMRNNQDTQTTSSLSPKIAYPF